MNNKLYELEQKIAAAKEAYYTTGTPLMSDHEYDILVSQAEKLGYIDKVGAKPVKDIATIAHEHPMLSLDKAHTEEELLKFAGDNVVLFMWKADGLSISATYIDGVLTRLETRGDGEIGNDIMFHANSFMNLPKIIDKPGKYVIDGECVILYSDFEKINSTGEKYANPRNLASGSLNQLDPKISAQRYLRFYAWDVIEGGCDSLHQNLIDAKKLGFDIVYNEGGCLSAQKDGFLKELLDRFRETARENGFPIDGVVLKFDSISFGRSLGMTDHHPRNAIAYKYEDDRYPTTLRSVDWQCGKTGILTPVLNFDPVEIDGTIVERCTAHNVSIYRQLNITEGCTCFIYKAGSIIPNCDCTESNGGYTIPVPGICPVCGGATKIVKQNDSEVLYCMNPNCAGKILSRLKHFVSKNGLDIDGLSEQTLNDLIKLDMVNSFEDIFKLSDHAARLKKIPGYGERSVEKLLAAIEKSRECDLAHFICALSIPNIGSVQAKTLAKKFGAWNEFYTAASGSYDFTQIDGFGSVLNSSLHKWAAENDVSGLVCYMKFKEEEFMNPPTGSFPLAGLTFCITGKVFKFPNRDAVKEKIESLGGKVSSGVTAKTDYLINNDSTSTSGKNKKAMELGTKIITEDEFLEMISE